MILDMLHKAFGVSIGINAVGSSCTKNSNSVREMESSLNYLNITERFELYYKLLLTDHQLGTNLIEAMFAV